MGACVHRPPFLCRGPCALVHAPRPLPHRHRSPSARAKGCGLLQLLPMRLAAAALLLLAAWCAPAAARTSETVLARDDRPLVLITSRFK